MKEKGKQRESLPSALYFTQPKFVVNFLQDLGLYRFQEEENTKCPQFTLIHKGEMGKRGVKRTKSKKCRQKFGTRRKFRTSAEFSHSGAKISHRGVKLLLLFFSSSAPHFLLISDLKC